MTDFTVNYNVFVNFDSHIMNMALELYKDYENYLDLEMPHKLEEKATYIGKGLCHKDWKAMPYRLEGSRGVLAS